MAGGVVSFIESEGVRVYHGDCIEIMRTLPDASVDSVVTDPPYELGFMGKKWDDTGIAYNLDVWREALRVLKPGGHLLAFGGTRTWHRLAVAIEDAGFEIRDNVAYLHDGGLPGPLAWCYGSGFPKSLDVSKAIDKAAGAEREVKWVKASNPKAIGGGQDGLEGATRPFIKKALRENGGMHATAGDKPATPAAQQWQGWGTALKPAFEPIVVARKPLIGTVAENVLAHGTGALNIDGCRIGTEVLQPQSRGVSRIGTFEGADGNVTPERTGRWPANVILDESQAAELDKQSGVTSSNRIETSPTTEAAEGWGNMGSNRGPRGHSDAGGASRFFYCPKAPKKERPNVDGIAHPTVKPIALMRYLVRLVTPPGGKVLEPFAGSGTTVEACILEGFDCIAIEMTDDYLPLINERVRRSTEDKQGRLL
jgi:hypothetical protein